VFRSFAIDGHVRSSDITTEPAVQHRMEIPLEGVVVRFGDSKAPDT